MSELLRHTLTSLALGLLVAGPLAALAIATLPNAWRSPSVVAVIAAASVGAVAWMRGVRPRER
jgi:hypothetical protein